jgi:chromosome segregation ATPase
MIADLIKDNLKPQAYRALFSLLGEPSEMAHLRSALETAERQIREELKETADRNANLTQDLELCRAERLEWMAKESTTRKDLHDSQERSTDLLEQVVRLTHQKREKAKDLLDQKFKTEATPLERTRFEMELTEARGRVRRAEDRAKKAEQQLAPFQAQIKDLKKQAKRAKQLESDLVWAKKQSTTHLQALGAAIAQIQILETKLARALKRTYAQPNIRKARSALTEKFEAA